MQVELPFHRDIYAFIHFQPDRHRGLDVLEDWLLNHCGQNLQHLINNYMRPVVGVFSDLKVNEIKYRLNIMRF